MRKQSLLAIFFYTVKSKVHFKGPSEFHNLNWFNNKMEDGAKGQCMQTKAHRPLMINMQ